MTDSRGFTLVELLFALALSAAVLVVSLASMKFASGLWDSGQRTADRAWIKRYFTTVVQPAFSSAFPRASGGAVFFSGARDRVAFATASYVEGMPWGGLRLVEYAVEDGCLLMREKALPEYGGPHSRETELSREVEAISFSYLGAAGWEDEWEGGEKDALPRAVRALVHVKGAGETFEFTMPLMLGGGRSE